MTRRDVLSIVRACLARVQHPEVEIVRNARGVNIGVRVSAASVKVAGRLAEQEYDRLAAKYPEHKNGGGE